MSDNKVKVVIVVLVGLPGSGKTSFCNRLKDYLNEKRLKINFFHVCFDKLFKVNQSVIDNRHFKTLRRNLFDLVKVLVKGIQGGEHLGVINYLHENHYNGIKEVSENFDSDSQISYVIVDDNNYYRSMRYPFYQLATEEKSGFCQIYCGVSTEISIIRDRNRTRKVGEEIIQRMALRLEKPIISNSWERRSYFIDTSMVDCDKVLSFLMTASTCSEEEERGRRKCKKVQTLILHQSEIHKVDLILRNAIHYRVQKVKPDSKAFTASILQEKRKSILHDIREGQIQISNYNVSDIEEMLNII